VLPEVESARTLEMGLIDALGSELAQLLAMESDEILPGYVLVDALSNLADTLV
jgi:hypothetical protein